MKKKSKILVVVAVVVLLAVLIITDRLNFSFIVRMPGKVVAWPTQTKAEPAYPVLTTIQTTVSENEYKNIKDVWQAAGCDRVTIELRNREKSSSGKMSLVLSNDMASGLGDVAASLCQYLIDTEADYSSGKIGDVITYTGFNCRIADNNYYYYGTIFVYNADQEQSVEEIMSEREPRFGWTEAWTNRVSDF